MLMKLKNYKKILMLHLKVMVSGLIIYYTGKNNLLLFVFKICPSFYSLDLLPNINADVSLTTNHIMVIKFAY